MLDQEYQKSIIVRENAARQARYKAGNPQDEADFSFANNKENKSQHVEAGAPLTKRDFFGRVITEEISPLQEVDGNAETDAKKRRKQDGKGDIKVWVSYHEGFSNAVRKPITIEELLRGL